MGWISCIFVFYVFLEAFLFFMFFLFSLRGGSWAGYPVFLFLCFSRSFSVSFCLFLCFRLVYLSFCMYNRTNIYNNIQTHKKLRDKHKQQKQHKYIISQPEPDKYLFAVGSKAGYLVFMLLFKCVSCVKRYTIIHVTCYHNISHHSLTHS